MRTLYRFVALVFSVSLLGGEAAAQDAIKIGEIGRAHV